MRIATFNVHFWTDSQQRSTVDDTIPFLKELRCDALALQEVPEGSDTLARVAAALNMHYAFAPAAFLGNALLSVRAPRAFEVLQLAAQPGEGRSAYIEERSAFVATLPWEGGTFRFVGTHLDPHCEQDRLQQLELLFGGLDARKSDMLTLVVGDFNSLCLSDYDAEALERIRKHRARSSREPPSGDVTTRLASRGLSDLWRLAPRSRRSAAELATCWAGTRIDYVFATASWSEHAHLLSCEHVPTSVSDHVPVVAEMQPRNAPV